MMVARRCAATVLALAVVVTACTREDEISVVTAPSTTAPATTVPPTTAPPTTAPATTVPPTTAPPTTVPPTTAPPTAPPTTAPPTTVALTTASLILMSDGIGPFRFGSPGADLVAQLAVPLGAPASDETVEYPVVIDGGFARDVSGDEVFTHPFGRSTCFANGLCVYAGGPTAADVAFVGWSFAGAVPPALATPTGVTSGARWSSFPTMVVNEGGCFQEGTGSIDGILLYIISEGTPFGQVDAAGNYVLGRPDPADAVVSSLQAGALPAFPFADC